MKALYHTLFLTLLALGSCTSSLYTGAEYDDLYYLPSDQPAVKSKPQTKDNTAKGNQQDEAYYDNIYAADTLVSDEYSDAVDNNDQLVVNGGNSDGAYNYSDYYSYSDRLNTFYGNYFYPYWRDPFYYGYPSYGLGFGIGFGFSFGWGYPYYGYGYPYYGYPYYGYPYYDYCYGYYPPYYGGGYYPPYYGGGYYPPYHNDDYYTAIWKKGKTKQSFIRLE